MFMALSPIPVRRNAVLAVWAAEVVMGTGKHNWLHSIVLNETLLTFFNKAGCSFLVRATRVRVHPNWMKPGFFETGADPFWRTLHESAREANVTLSFLLFRLIHQTPVMTILLEVTIPNHNFRVFMFTKVHRNIPETFEEMFLLIHGIGSSFEGLPEGRHDLFVQSVVAGFIE